jgi:hypothetical protein
MKGLHGGIGEGTADNRTTVGRDYELEEPRPPEIDRSVLEASVVEP